MAALVHSLTTHYKCSYIFDYTQKHFSRLHVALKLLLKHIKHICQLVCHFDTYFTQKSHIPGALLAHKRRCRFQPVYLIQFKYNTTVNP